MTPDRGDSGVPAAIRASLAYRGVIAAADWLRARRSRVSLGLRPRAAAAVVLTAGLVHLLLLATLVRPDSWHQFVVPAVAVAGALLLRRLSIDR